MSKAFVAFGNKFYNKVVLKSPQVAKRVLAYLQNTAQHWIAQYKLAHNPLTHLKRKAVFQPVRAYVARQQRTLP